MGIRHNYQSPTANDGSKEVSSTRWNEDHVISTSINLPPQASDPAAPVDGDLWATASGSLKAKLGGTVVAIAVAATTLAGYGIANALTTDSAQTITSAGTKTFRSNALFLADATDSTKKGTFVLSAIATGTTRSYTLPDASGTLVIGGGTASGTNTGDQTITLTGDVTGSGTGSFAATLATVNASVGSFGSATQVATLTVDAKGRLTAAGNATISIPVSAISDSGAAGRAVVQGATAAAIRTGLGLGALATLSTVDLSTLATGTLQAAQEPAHTGDVTNIAGSLAMTIAPAAVTLAKMANLAANSIIGNNTGIAATPAALTASQVKTLLAIASSDVSGLGSLATLSSVDLSGAQATGTLAAGRFPALTGDVTTTAGSLATTIANNAVTAAKFQQVASGTIIGRVAALTGNVQALTGTQVTSILDVATTTVKGLVPAPGTASGLFLRDDLTWAAASGGSGSPGGTNGQIQFNNAGAFGGFTMSGDATITTGGVLTVANGAITLAKMANLAANSILGNNTGSAATPIALTAAQVVSLIGAVDISSTQTIGGNKTFSGTTTFSGYTQFNNWAAADATDPTKIGAFDMSAISTGTTRTYTFPNASGTLALTSNLASYQPLDGDLTALAALSGTNTIYYRSAADTWSAVTIGSNLSFSAGTLSASSGGITALTGDVTASGTGSVAATLATVNSNTGSFGSATQVAQLTLDGKGRVTAAANVTVTPAWSSITSKPTTVSGFGITDAVDTSTNQTVGGTKTFSSPIPLTGQTTDPSSPADGTIWYDSQIRTLKTTLGTRTEDLFAAIANSGAFVVKAIAGGTSFTGLGVASPTVVGTATAATIAVTNKHTYYPRVEALVTVASTTAVAGWRWTATQVGVGGASSDLGGFRCTMIWGPATGVATTTNRAFCGLAPVGTPTDVEPSSQTNGIWMGWDAADTNIQIMCNDGTATATKVDLGASFPVPTVDRTSIYKLDLYSPKGTTQSVQWRVTDMVSGAVATGTQTTDLPATSTLIAPKVWMSVGGTSSVIGVALMSVYLDPLL